MLEKVSQPVLLLALALLYFFDGKVEFILQRLDQVSVAVTGIQSVGKDLPDGMSPGSDFTADSNDERFFQVHRLCGISCKENHFFRDIKQLLQDRIKH